MVFPRVPKQNRKSLAHATASRDIKEADVLPSGSSKKREGVNGEVMVRLRTFHEMNVRWDSFVYNFSFHKLIARALLLFAERSKHTQVTRVIFRSIFVGSLLALGIDGVRGHVHHLNEIP